MACILLKIVPNFMYNKMLFNAVFFCLPFDHFANAFLFVLISLYLYVHFILNAGVNIVNRGLLKKIDCIANSFQLKTAFACTNICQLRRCQKFSLICLTFSLVVSQEQWFSSHRCSGRQNNFDGTTLLSRIKYNFSFMGNISVNLLTKSGDFFYFMFQSLFTFEQFIDPSNDLPIEPIKCIYAFLNLEWT